VAFFTEHASGPLVKPIRKIRPLKAARQHLPSKARAAPQPLAPKDSLSWSERSGESFFL